MISNETLSKVLGFPVVIKGLDPLGEHIIFDSHANKKNFSALNLDTLNTKCKAWLIEKGYYFNIQYRVYTFEELTQDFENLTGITELNIHFDLYHDNRECLTTELDIFHGEGEVVGMIYLVDWVLEH